MVLKTRERLIEVARQLFARKGVERTTMNDIACASDKGRRTVYTYFKSKREIYNAVVESESDAMVGRLRQIVANENDDAETKLRKFMEVRMSGLLHDSEASRSVRGFFSREFRRMERVRRMACEKESTLLGEILQGGISAGIFGAEQCSRLEVFLPRLLQGIDLGEATATESQQSNIEAMKHVFVDFVVSALRPGENEK